MANFFWSSHASKYFRDGFEYIAACTSSVTFNYTGYRIEFPNSAAEFRVSAVESTSTSAATHQSTIMECNSNVTNVSTSTACFAEFLESGNDTTDEFECHTTASF